jgi:hypothetical protein
MGYSSQAGQVLIRKQAAKGTFAADFDAEHVALKLRSGSLGPNRELLITDPEIGGGRDTVDAYLGAASWAGDFDFYARPDSITTLLEGVLGTAATTAPVAPDTKAVHTITPSDSAILPFYSIEERIGSGLEAYQYTDTVVNTFHLEAEANGYLTGTVGLIAARQEAGITPTADPAWDDSNLIVGTNIVLTFGGIALPAKSFSFDITNNFEDDDFRLGSFYLGDLTAKSREVSGSFTIRPEDSALWRRAVYGAASAVEVGGLTSKAQLVINCQTYEDIAGSNPPAKSSINIDIGQIALEPYAFEPSGDDVIENDISWRALRPVAANPIATVTVTNGRATIA